MPPTTLPAPPNPNGVASPPAKLAEMLVISHGRTAYAPGGGLTLAEKSDDVIRSRGHRAYDLMMEDAIVGSAVDLVVQSALGDRLQCAPIYPAPPDGKPDPKHERAKMWSDFGDRLIERLDRPVIDTLGQMGREAFKVGVCNAEKVWEVPGRGPDRGKLVLNRLAVLDRRSWRFVVNPHNRVVAIEAQTADGVRWIAPEKFAWLTLHAQADDPRGHSGLRRAWTAYDMKAQMLPSERSYQDHFGEPSVVLTMPKPEDMPPQLYEVDADGNEDTSKPINPLKAAQVQVAGFKNRSYMIIPGGSVFQIVESRGNGQAFAEAAGRYDRWIDAAILGASNVRQEADQGGYAQSKTHAGIFGLRVAYYRTLIEQMIRWQVLYRALKYNAGEDEADEYTPTVTLGTGDQDDRSTLFDAIAKLRLAGFKPSTLAPLLAEAGLPEEADPEPLPPPDPVAPPAPPGGGNRGQQPPAEAA